MFAYHPGFEYTQPPIPASTKQLLSNTTDLVGFDSEGFGIELPAKNLTTTVVVAGIHGIQGLLNEFVHYTDDVREAALLTADVCIDIAGPGKGQFSYATLSYAEFEERMARLGLSSIYDPRFTEVWARELQEQQRLNA